MSLPQNFADADVARKIAHELYPKAQSIGIIEHSADNIVALVDTSCAIRFPRNKDGYLRGQYEWHILKRLEGLHILSVPRILNVNADPPYVITSFVPGKHVSAADVRTFSESQQIDFGKSVAQFAYKMHITFNLNEELQLRKDLSLDDLATGEPWPSYLKKVVYDGYFSTPQQDEIAKRCYTEWVKHCDVVATTVIHDDLHTENMMFNNNRLIGVLDFGDTNVGTPEQELRQLYRINEKILMEAVDEYQHLSGKKLNANAIKLWAIMKELADYSRATSKDTNHHSLKRTSRNLNDWFPEGKWGESYDLSQIEDHQ
jgi:aminoglycoside phosphotransferase (APT) family kinase protein